MSKPRHTSPWLLGLLLPALLGVDLLQTRNRATEAGNTQFKVGKAEEALAEYDKAAGKLPQDPGVQFNRGAALYALGRWDEASEAFLRATEDKNTARKAQAFYNYGNALYQGKKFGEATAAFKKALAYDPADMKAKWNLELALRKKTEEEKNKKDQQQDNKDDKDKKDNKKDGKQEQQAQNDKKDDKGDDKGGSGQDKGDKPNSPQQEPKPPEQEKDKQAEQQPAKEDQKSPPQQAGQKPPENPAGGKGAEANKDPQNQPKPGMDSREVEAILDNIEKSPKSLEQELARLRAAHRRPPAKDW